MDFRYLLDTNICSELIRNPQGKVAQKLFHVGTNLTAINWVVEAELRFGAQLKNSEALTQRVEILIHELNLVEFNQKIATHYADIRTQLTQDGCVIGANDLWIAAHARSLNLCVITNNVKEFSRVSELRVENWF